MKFMLFVMVMWAVALVIDATLAPDQVQSGVSISPTITEVRPNRRLRMDTTERNNEERTIPGLSNLKTWLTPSITKLSSSDTEQKLFQQWLKNEQTPEDILKLLQLDGDFATFLKSPKFNTVVNFITVYNEKVAVKNPENAVTMLGVFVKTYGGEAMAKSLEVARKDPKMENLSKWMQGDLLTGWAANGLTTDTVYKRLNVDEEGVTNLFTTPSFNVWANFDNMVNHYHPDREKHVLNQLTQSFGEIPLAKAIELASKEDTMNDVVYKLQQPLFEKWVRERTTPKDLETRLKLDRVKWAYDPSEEIVNEYRKVYVSKVVFGRKKLVNPK